MGSRESFILFSGFLWFRMAKGQRRVRRKANKKRRGRRRQKGGALLASLLPPILGGLVSGVPGLIKGIRARRQKRRRK